jgi:hypothetical protein
MQLTGAVRLAPMSMTFDPKEELDHIAEFADSGVRVFQRQGSLVGIKGAYGLKKWLYHKWRNVGTRCTRSWGRWSQSS